MGGAHMESNPKSEIQNPKSKLTVLVLGGGPDSERSVSLKSAAAVAAALRRAGHAVVESDIMPNDPAPLDTACDVIFPAMHGPFGEGGPLQELLDERGTPYVGCGPGAARTAMDKLASKAVAKRVGVPVAADQTLSPGDELTIAPPVVIKPVADGSSVGVTICRDAATAAAARAKLHGQGTRCFAEAFIAGRELTVGVLGDRVLPPIMIVPAADAGFYDFDAKYERNDTRYEFDIDLPAAVLSDVQRHARAVFEGVGCRHLSRVDFIVDAAGKPWFLELNTMPGFTDHSLLPMAAARTGLDMAALCDHLVRLALND
ncbi:MAG: D-alanine--D-alanine ligase [Phycisphaera sp.]|nr:D-alanine--D-alanine ligase [Phycisphaera sp.]